MAGVSIRALFVLLLARAHRALADGACPGRSVSRRTLLTAACAAAPVGARPVAAAQSVSSAELERRLRPLGASTKLRRPPAARDVREELAAFGYPSWLDGLWLAEVTFESFCAPLGPLFADEAEVAQAEADAAAAEVLRYPMRFARREGGAGGDVQQDRPFNAVAETTAFLGADSGVVVSGAAYDTSTGLLRLSAKRTDQPATPGAAPPAGAGQMLIELQTLSCACAAAADPAVWLTSELFEQRVCDAPLAPTERSCPPTLVETIVRFEREAAAPGAPPGARRAVSARNRIAKYAGSGTLGGALSGGCAVSAFDYTWKLMPVELLEQSQLRGSSLESRMS